METGQPHGSTASKSLRYRRPVCPLHKKPDDIQQRLREGGIKEQGERSQEGVQRAVVRATEKKEEEGGSHCLTGSPQTG